MVAMPHLTCTGQTRDDIEALLERYRDEGLENVLALAGDPPLADEPPGDFSYAVELIELVKDVGDFSIGVAAFPEIHPRSPDRDADRRFLAEKLRVADFGITQFFWTAEHYFRMIDELAGPGRRHAGHPERVPDHQRGRRQALRGPQRRRVPAVARRPARPGGRRSRRGAQDRRRGRHRAGPGAAGPGPAGPAPLHDEPLRSRSSEIYANLGLAARAPTGAGPAER